MRKLVSLCRDLATSTGGDAMGVEEVDPCLKQLYLQKPYVKVAKKASLLATIYEEPVQKTKSKEPQLMAARGLKRYLDFESQAEFAKRRRKREARALSHQIQKQRARLAQAEPETQVNACGRPKRRAASVSEAATKVMTILDAPVNRNNHLSLHSNKEYRQDCDETYAPPRSAMSRDSKGDDGRERVDCKRDILDKETSLPADKERPHSSRERRKVLKPLSRIPKEVRDVLGCIVDIVVTVDRCVHGAQTRYTDHDYALLQPDVI
ncbi:hypothetical protein BIW11_10109 [Tropilaelaps mercedesae]|uniref:Uncharacterized protein n=1 Tax=Tropilaelaps mercedesae TaxID=418985 RepID=A0A1V9XHK9_9ACAR|nr:hypothetical protein BIW11_10109 [Tropilaelaps mercedesae]